MKRNSLYNTAYWIIWSLIISVCAFFIVKNAQWGIGDDAIIMRHTGSGVPFSPGDTTRPTIGRFYPFAYLLYDLLLPFTNGYVSAFAHYWIHLVAFVLMSFAFAWLFSKLLESENLIWRCVISLSATFVIVFRLYPDYLNCFSTIWNPYSLIALFVCFVWLYHNYNKKAFAVIALLLINYATYCLETIFVIPLSLGLFGIIYCNKHGKKESWFYYSLLFSGLLYLVLYGILIYPHIENAYDGTHGTDVSLIGNALHMLWGNKILLLAIIVLVCRFFDIVIRKKDLTVFDNLLLASAAYCLACFVLKLNWTMYYNIGAILAFPPIVYFCQNYLKAPLTFIILVALMSLYGYKLPNKVRNSQIERVQTAQQMEVLTDAYLQGGRLFWYTPDIESAQDIEIRDWRKASLCTYIRWIIRNPSFEIESRESFSDEDTGIWLVPMENKGQITDDRNLSRKGELCFSAGGIDGYTIE